MIFLVHTDDPYENMCLQHQARFITYRLRRSGQPLANLEEAKPLESLGNDENLYIIGHGDRKNPSLSGLTAEELYAVLIQKGLSIYLKRLTVVLICCHAGYKPSVFEKSFSEKLYDCMIKNLSTLELRHRSKEGSLPKVIAPKHVIKLTNFDPSFMGITHELYDECEKIRETKPNSLDQWYEDHAKELTATDFQLTTMLRH